MKLRIQIDTPAPMEGLPKGTKEVEIEADSPAECMFQMQRRGCGTDYIRDVLNHLAPIWGPEFPHWYNKPDKERIQKDLIECHGAYGYDGPRYD